MDRLKQMIIGGVLIALGLLTGPAALAAAPRVDFVGPVGDVHLGDTVAVEVRVDSGGQTINAAEITITYATDRLTADRVGREQSALTLWPEEPTIDATRGTIRLVGGRPGGFVAAPAVVATLYVRPRQAGPTTLSIDAPRSALYAHDGRGTKISVPAASLTFDVREATADELILTSRTHPEPTAWGRDGRINVHWSVVEGHQYSYRLSTDPLAVPDDVAEDTAGDVTYTGLADGVYVFTIKDRGPNGRWSSVRQRRFLLDQTPPSPFALSFLDGRTTDGRSRLSWLAFDETSGVDRAELRVNGRSPRTVTSSLLLESAWAGSILTVTVFDRAGNSRSASWRYPATNASGWRYPAWSVVIPIFLVVVVLLVAAAYRRRAR